jgi:hypothetical protein
MARDEHASLFRERNEEFRVNDSNQVVREYLADRSVAQALTSILGAVGSIVARTREIEAPTADQADALYGQSDVLSGVVSRFKTGAEGAGVPVAALPLVAAASDARSAGTRFAVN